MYLDYPIAYTNHPLGKADPWPCRDAFIVYGPDFPLICLYTFYGGETYEIANCNDPRNYDDRRANFITRLPVEPGGERVVLYEAPTEATDFDAIEGELLELQLELPARLAGA